MKILIAITITCLVLSLLKDRGRTLAGIRKGMSLFANLLPAILTVVIIVSIILYLTPQEDLIRYFGNDSGIAGYAFAATAGFHQPDPGHHRLPHGEAC